MLAREMIAAVRAAAVALAEAKAHEQLLEDGRGLEKGAAVARIMQLEDPLMGKAYSATSAEKVVERDSEYANYRRRQAEAVKDSQIKWGEYEAARLSAELEIALIRAGVTANSLAL